MRIANVTNSDSQWIIKFLWKIKSELFSLLSQSLLFKFWYSYFICLHRNAYLLILFLLLRTVYHCPFCNLCRVGRGLGIDYFHCMTCNCCLGIKLVNHKCLEKGLETNCPICCDFLFTSSATVRALPCGHYMHSACFQVFLSRMLLFCHLSFTFSSYTFFLLKEIERSGWIILKPCFVLLGIHLQSLHLSNLQQINGRYGGKRTFSFPLLAGLSFYYFLYYYCCCCSLSSSFSLIITIVKSVSLLFICYLWKK